MSSIIDQEAAVRSLRRSVWSSLYGHHSHLAETRGGSIRYEPDVAPFGALREQSDECLSDLADLVRSGQEVCLVDQTANAPHLFEPVNSLQAVQMLYVPDHAPAPGGPDSIRELSVRDTPSMESLIALVFPGYFRRRTREMGHYYGIFEGSELIAMAGERLAPAGYRELSAVCTHPAHQGKGLAAALTTHVVTRMVDRSERPFLHVGSANGRARQLYARLGFAEIADVDVNFYRRR